LKNLKKNCLMAPTFLPREKADGRVNFTQFVYSELMVKNKTPYVCKVYLYIKCTQIKTLKCFAHDFITQTN